MLYLYIRGKRDNQFDGESNYFQSFIQFNSEIEQREDGTILNELIKKYAFLHYYK